MAAAAIPIAAAAIGGGASLMGANKQKKAIERARREQTEAANAAQARLQPYQEQGEYATQQIREGLDTGTLGGSFQPTDLASDPSYQFRLEQGEQALNRGLNSGGNLYSGQAIKERERYAQGLASQEYDDAYNRWLQTQQNRQGLLQNQQKIGYMGAGGQNTIGLDEGQNAANATMARRRAQDEGTAGVIGAFDSAAQMGMSAATGGIGGMGGSFMPSQNPSLYGATGGIPPGGFGGTVGY